MSLRPGEIYYADFGDDDRHRVVIVSREELNRGTYAVTVPFTSKKFEIRSNLPSCVVFFAGEFGCTENCVARADQLTTMHLSEIQLHRGLIAKLDDEKFQEIIQAIAYVLNADLLALD
jgi:mRNA-degrading endonuclease toxin of MazEF toxin-antitoxin module